MAFNNYFNVRRFAFTPMIGIIRITKVFKKTEIFNEQMRLHHQSNFHANQTSMRMELPSNGLNFHDFLNEKDAVKAE